MTAADHPTHSKPAGRTPRDQLLQQMGRLSSDMLMTNVAHGSASFLATLNSDRQIVFANRSMLNTFSVVNEDAIGRRPGELISCRSVDLGPTRVLNESRAGLPRRANACFANHAASPNWRCSTGFWAFTSSFAADSAPSSVSLAARLSP